MKQKIHDAGPLKLPVVPPNVAGRLRGHATSARWLPERLSPELDELRERQLRYRDQVAAELAELAALVAKFSAEDGEFGDAERAAFRAGKKPAADHRTPTDKRAALLAASEERVVRGAEVFADLVDEVVEYLRRNETHLLVPLNERLNGAREKRRQAEALLAAARDEEFIANRMGDWLLHECDADGAFDKQPYPVDARAPAGWCSPSGAIARPWTRVRAWADDEPDAKGASKVQANPALQDLAGGLTS